MNYFAELPVDMYSNIFDYLSQLELTNILILNKSIYSQCMKYISKNININININIDDFSKLYENDQIISLNYMKDIRIIMIGFKYACDNANIIMMKMLYKKGFGIIEHKKLYLNQLLDNSCLTRDLVNRDNRYKEIKDIPVRNYTKVIKYLINNGATKCGWCGWKLNSGKLHN